MNCSLVFFSTQKFLWSSWWNYIYTFHFNQCQYLGVVRRVQNRMRNLTKSKNEILGTSVTWSLSELESSVNWNMSSHISILYHNINIHYSPYSLVSGSSIISQPPCFSSHLMWQSKTSLSWYCNFKFIHIAFGIFHIPREGGQWS